MEKIEINRLSENFIEAVGKEWMLITAGVLENFNMMTASWGGMGYLWNKPVAFIFVRPERYTYEFIEKSDYFTLSFLGKLRKVYNICGSKSGRDIDKLQATGLNPIETKLGNVLYKEARLSMECKKLYTDVLRAENFIGEVADRFYGEKEGGFHRLYIGEILNTWVTE